MGKTDGAVRVGPLVEGAAEFPPRSGLARLPPPPQAPPAIPSRVDPAAPEPAAASRDAAAPEKRKGASKEKGFKGSTKNRTGVADGARACARGKRVGGAVPGAVVGCPTRLSRRPVELTPRCHSRPTSQLRTSGRVERHAFASTTKRSVRTLAMAAEEASRWRP